MFVRLPVVPVPGRSEPGAGELEQPGGGLSAVREERASPVSTAHLPERPSWDCLACGKPWPCDPARDALRSEMDLISLSIYMWARIDEAVEDLPDGPPGELFQRFLRWTRPPSTRPGGVA